MDFYSILAIASFASVLSYLLWYCGTDTEHPNRCIMKAGGGGGGDAGGDAGGKINERIAVRLLKLLQEANQRYNSEI